MIWDTKRPVDRRAFLQMVGLAGAAAGAAMILPGCKQTDPSHAERSVKALMNVFIPSEGPQAPGALEARSYELLSIKDYMSPVVELGYIQDLPPAVQGVVLNMARNSNNLDEQIRNALTLDLDAAVLAKFGNATKTFEDLSLTEQTHIVEEKYQLLEVRPLYDFVRATCMLAFLAAPLSDAGFQYIGMGPYADMAKRIHNTGYADYSANLVPAVNGLQVWDETVNGDLP